MRLSGKTIALLIAPKGTEDVEFTQPLSALQAAGARVQVIGLKSGSAETVKGDLELAGTHRVDLTIDQAAPENFDGVVIPGGTVGADRLRADARAVAFVRSLLDQGKPVAAICHGPWLLIETKLLEGRTLTSYPSLQTDLRNAGAIWVDQEVAVDNGLVTSRTPDDLPAFCAKLIEEIAEGRHR